MMRSVVQLPAPGGTYIVGPAASAQFAEPIAVRVIGVTPPVPFSEFCWLDVYQLDSHGEAACRREIYIRPTGLRGVSARPPRWRLPVNG